MAPDTPNPQIGTCKCGNPIMEADAFCSKCTTTPPTPSGNQSDAATCSVELFAGVASYCPHCKDPFTDDHPILEGDEDEPIKDSCGAMVAMRLALDPRPKCSRCHGRFGLIIHLPNV